MPIPDYQQLMLPVLKYAAEGETRVPLIAERIADQLGLTESEREEMLPSGTQRLLHNRIHWAKFYMSKAGLIDSPRRGLFVASPAGRTLLATNPERIDLETLKAYRSFVEFYSTSTKTISPTEAPVTSLAASSFSTPEEQIDAAHSVLASALRADLLSRVLEQSPAFLNASSSIFLSRWGTAALTKTLPCA